VVERAGAAPVRWCWTTAGLTAGALILAAVAAPSLGGPDRGLAWLLFVGSSVHVASTGWFLSVPGVRRLVPLQRNRLVAAPVALIAAGAVGAAAMDPEHIGWLLLPFFAWQFHHFAKQNVGLVALAAGSGRLRGPGRYERRSIVAAAWCGTLALTARPSLLQLSLRPLLPALFDVAVVGFVVSVGVGLVAVVLRRRADRPLRYCALYAAALLFPLPVFVCHSPYAAVGGMTIAHGVQYLVLVGLVAAGPSGRPRRRRDLAVLGCVGLAGGGVLNVLSHLHGSGSAAVRALFGVYLGVCCAHFVMDAGLWRLRDHSVRRFLGTRLPFLVRSGDLHRLPIDRLPI
jgi:hypothetical protein